MTRQHARILLTAVIVTLMFGGGAALVSAGAKTTDPCPGGLEPDLQAVVPHHLGVQNTGGREYLRLANGIADVGAGPWHLRPQTVIVGEGGTTTAIQDIWSTRDGASDPTAASCVASQPPNSNSTPLTTIGTSGAWPVSPCRRRPMTGGTAGSVPCSSTTSASRSRSRRRSA